MELIELFGVFERKHVSEGEREAILASAKRLVMDTKRQLRLRGTSGDAITLIFGHSHNSWEDLRSTTKKVFGTKLDSPFSKVLQYLEPEMYSLWMKLSSKRDRKKFSLVRLRKGKQ